MNPDRDGLTYAVVALLAVTAVVDALAAAAAWSVRGLFLGPLADHPDPAGFGDLGLATAGALQCLLVPVTAVFLAVLLRRRRAGAGWWAGLGVVALVTAGGTWAYASADTVAGFVTGAGALAAADLLNALVAVLAGVFVLRPTSMQGPKSTGMIPAAQ
ncbi:hypothetical protein [Streptomyces sp. NPDC101115]|uniref:hypothetical protein n=1 Tax=Streptomyces sp. NPDC101115 TaxID=3366106 RepID=UPI0038258BEB